MQARLSVPASQELCLPPWHLAELRRSIPEAQQLCCADITSVQGSLHRPEDPKMGERLALIMGRSSRDAQLYLRKWLREALRQAGIQPKVRSKAGMRKARQISPESMQPACCTLPQARCRC